LTANGSEQSLNVLAWAAELGHKESVSAAAKFAPNRSQDQQSMRAAASPDLRVEESAPT